MKIAWFGPEPTSGGGVPYVATQLLAGLAAAGVAVDAYVAGEQQDLSALEELAGVRVIREPTGWHWGRWYSRNPLMAITSGQVARLRAQRRLVARLRATHASQPYDVLYQFSQFESPWSRRDLAALPPVVVHPEVHAAGELRWLWRERALSRRCEPMPRRLAIAGILGTRALMQRRSVSAVDAFIAPSEAFARDIERDYRIDVGRVHVVPNPIDLSRFAPPSAPTAPGEVVELVYVSRIAVRKGVELVVDLSHRLRDLAGAVRLRVIGDKSMFSDYRVLLADLNPQTATYLGPLPALDLADCFRAASILIQPSHYEPFALTVGEALASGLAVVASDQVGAAERVDRRACRVFPVGDAAGFERATRQLIDDVRSQGPALRALARTEAERLFAPAVVARELARVLETVAARSGPRGSAG